MSTVVGLLIVYSENAKKGPTLRSVTLTSCNAFIYTAPYVRTKARISCTVDREFFLLGPLVNN